MSVTKIRPLHEIKFEDAANVGVKAANLATLRTFEFPDHAVPDGFAVPFYFYDEFMKHNGFYAEAQKMLADSGSQQDREFCPKSTWRNCGPI